MPDNLLLRIDVDEVAADDEERAEIARRLRRVLLELDVESVTDATSGPAPEDSKGLELAEAGALLVSLAPALLKPLADLLQRWLGDRATRTVKMTVDGDTIEVSGISAADESRLVDDWLRRREKAVRVSRS
jgi:hypothetical protein